MKIKFSDANRYKIERSLDGKQVIVNKMSPPESER